MRGLLDTNIVIYLQRGEAAALFATQANGLLRAEKQELGSALIEAAASVNYDFEELWTQGEEPSWT